MIKVLLAIAMMTVNFGTVQKTVDNTMYVEFANGQIETYKFDGMTELEKNATCVYVINDNLYIK